MIKINLLPPEQRPVDRTPVPRLALILLTTLAGVGLLAYIAYLILVEVRAKNDELVEARKKLRQYDAQVKQYDQLDGDLKKEIAKTADIEKIAVRDVPWWQVIDALWSVVAVQDRRVWLETIQVLDDKGASQIVRGKDPMARAFPPYGLRVTCYAAGLDIQEITRFRLDLKKNPVIRKYLPTMNLDPTFRVNEERDFVDGVSLFFEIVLLADMPKPGGKK
ncbi:MAG: hypothetical protein HYY17_15910 [Planctomycetes bacterium]|nr:hypothetical protein [Planctomycetota bacterium]